MVLWHAAKLVYVSPFSRAVVAAPATLCTAGRFAAMKCPRSVRRRWWGRHVLNSYNELLATNITTQVSGDRTREGMRDGFKRHFRMRHNQTCHMYKQVAIGT
jgi:hypothetical protein